MLYWFINLIFKGINSDNFKVNWKSASFKQFHIRLFKEGDKVRFYGSGRLRGSLSNRLR